MFTSRLLQLLSVLALSCTSLCGHAQVQNADDWVVPKKKRLTKVQQDSTIRAYVASKGYTRYFNNFYQSPDGEHWRLIGNRYGSVDDSTIVVFQSCPFIDSITFRRLGDDYFADKSGVYCDLGQSDLEGVKPIKGASIATFRPVGSCGLAVDDQHVYWYGGLLPELKPNDVRMYAMMGRCTEHGILRQFFVGSTAVYQDYTLLPNKTARNFKVPKGWELTYPKDKPRAKGQRR
jgi:hypothetical protein